MLTQLTPQQQALLAKVQEEWEAIALSTEPSDREAAEEALALAYASRELSPPATVVWLGSPLAGALAAAMLTGFVETATRRAAPDDELAELIDRVSGELSRQVPREVWKRTRGRTEAQVLHRLRGRVEGRLQGQLSYQVWGQVQCGIRPVIEPLLWALNDWIYQRLVDFLLAGAPEESGLADQMGVSSWGAHGAEPGTYAYLEKIGVEGGGGAAALRDLGRSCGWCWTFEEVAIMSERPSLISLDEEGRIHSETGPAISYPDGFMLFALHGAVGVHPELATNPAAITFTDIETEGRLGMRALLIERFGEKRYTEESARKRPGLRFVVPTPMPYQPGGAVQQPPKSIRIDEFLLAIPYRMSSPLGGPPAAIPARAILNSIFRTGKASGDYEWEAFEVDEKEYAELVSALRRAGYRALPEPPSWVQTEEDWSFWVAEQDHGVPADELRRLDAESKSAYQAYLDSWEEAVRERDPLLPVRRWHASVSLSRAVCDLKAGRPRGSTDQMMMDEPLGRMGRRRFEAEMALKASERLGDGSLVEKRRAELAEAESELAPKLHAMFAEEV